MNKIKLFIASMLGAIALVFACVLGTRVNAADEQYGKYTVTNTDTTSTAVWDFSNADDMPDANVTVKGLTDNTLYGIGGDASKGITLKATEKNISNNKTGVLYVPVPSADAAGTITLLGSSSNSARTLTLAVVTQNEGNTLTNKVYEYSSSAVNITFDSSYITTSGSTYWLKFDPNGQEVKLKKITVALTSSTQYAATAVTHVVTIKDGDTTLKTYDVNDGEAFDKTLSIWGYSSISLYTNAGLTDAYTDAAITADTTLWVSKTADTTDYGYNLTKEMISTLSGVYNSTTEDIKITDYYTKKVSAVATSSYLQLKNTEAQSLIINVPVGGLKVRVSCSSGGSSERSIKLFKTDFNANEVTSFTTVLPSDSYNPVNVFAELEEGKYYLAGTDNIRIYSITMSENVEDVTSLSFDAQYDADGTAATKLRFIGTIEGLATTEYTKIETITFTFDFNGDDDRALSVTQLYLSIIGYDQYAAASNKMYFVYQLDNINKVAYAGLKLTDCKLTVVFNNGSSQTTTHADITLPAFA